MTVQYQVVSSLPLALVGPTYLEHDRKKSINKSFTRLPAHYHKTYTNANFWRDYFEDWLLYFLNQWYSWFLDLQLVFFFLHKFDFPSIFPHLGELKTRQAKHATIVSPLSKTPQLCHLFNQKSFATDCWKSTSTTTCGAAPSPHVVTTDSIIKVCDIFFGNNQWFKQIDNGENKNETGMVYSSFNIQHQRTGVSLLFSLGEIELKWTVRGVYF